MGKLPNRSEMKTEDAPADQFQGSDHKNKKSNNKLADPGINPKKKAAGGKPPMSPIRQVMKAVTSLALNPKKRKKAAGGGNGDNVKTAGEAGKKSVNTIYKNQG